MAVSRREFCEWLGASGLAAASLPSASMRCSALPGALRRRTAALAHRHPLSVRPEAGRPLAVRAVVPAATFRSLERVAEDRARQSARAPVLRAASGCADARDHPAEDRGDYVQEYLTFQTTPDLRVPAYVLIPKNAEAPRAGDRAAALSRRLLRVGQGEGRGASSDEHRGADEFKQQLYGGKSIATELVRRGYVVITSTCSTGASAACCSTTIRRRIAIRRDDEDEIAAFNRRSQPERATRRAQPVHRGHHLAGRHAVGRPADARLSRQPPGSGRPRLGCVGLSVGGYRSFLLAALDPRIKAAVDVGWMSSFGSHIKRHVVNSIGLTFHIAGLYRYLDLPDLAALIAPRSVLVINGSKDHALSAGGCGGGLREDRAVLSQGRRAGPAALPAVRRAAPVQRRDAGGRVGVAGTLPLACE